MLELKGIPYKRVDLMPVISRGVLRGLRFPSNTVPSLSIAGTKLTGSRTIARELDRIVPEPPLYPSEPEPRAAVEEAELWGDETLQAPVRRILWNAIQRNRAVLRSYAEGARLGIPIGLAVKTAAPMVAAARRMSWRCAPSLTFLVTLRRCSRRPGSSRCVRASRRARLAEHLPAPQGLRKAAFRPACSAPDRARAAARARSGGSSPAGGEA